jgi:hypothetical protein
MDACEQKRDHHALISNEASLANLLAELSDESRTDQAVVVEGKVTIAHSQPSSFSVESLTRILIVIFTLCL